MIRTQIQLTEQQADRLKRLADREGISLAAMIRRAVDSLIERSDRDVVIDRALSAIGAGSSGLPDVGAEHDRYLDESYGDG